MWLHSPSKSCPSTPVSEELNLDSPRLSELAQSVTVRGNYHASKFLLKELKKVGLTKLLYTVTLPPSPQRNSKTPISLQRDSHAHPGPGPIHQKTGAKMMNETDGPIPSGSFARYDPLTFSWKTSQISLITGTLEPYSETWPRQGSMRNGTVSQAPISMRHRSDRGSSYCPTPTARDFRDGASGHYDYPTNAYLGREVPRWMLRNSSHLPPMIWKGGHRCGKKCLMLRPAFVSWLQGFPIGWGSCKSMETLSFQQWQGSLSNLFQKIL